MEEEFIEKITFVDEQFGDDFNRKFVAQTALATQKWVQDLRREGITEPFENWSVEFIVDRLKQHKNPE